MSKIFLKKGTPQNDLNQKGNKNEKGYPKNVSKN
jgi:hypothetical protein